jgi:hypothetical protein
LALYHQDADGKVRDVWGPTAIRITELALTPDFKHLVALGMEFRTTKKAIKSSDVEAGELDKDSPLRNDAAPFKMIVFDFATRQTESCVVIRSWAFMTTEDVLIHCFADCSTCARSTRLEGELTSMQITQDFQYALINHSPNVRG